MTVEMDSKIKRAIAHCDVSLINQNLEVLVCSHGGCGTTMFMDFLSSYKNVNNMGDTDTLKHLKFPPWSIPKKCTVVFIYSDPIQAAASIIDRNYEVTHARKFGNLFWKGCSDVNEYAKQGSDELLLNRVMRNWTQKNNFKRGYEILYIQYEYIWERKDEIFNILDIEDKETENFPNRRKRSEKNISKESKEILKRVYNPFYKIMKSMDPVEIIRV